MIIKGFSHKFSLDNINTDYIIAGKYKFKTLDMKELSKHLMEDLQPEFYKKIKKGDFLVGGSNFGCGSSREQAPKVIIEAGISCVIAKSFARIFYRNSINCGLTLIECNTDKIEDNDKLQIDLESGKIKNITKKTEISFKPIPEFMQKILKEGGLEGYFKKYKKFKI